MRLSEKLAARLSASFRRAAAQEDGGKGSALRSVLMVGAIATPDTLNDADGRYLRHAFSALKKCGVGIAPAFTVDVVNIARQYGGEDFLTSPGRADLVLLCNIYNPRKPGGHKQESFRKGYLAGSPRHFETGIWHDSVIRTGASALFVVGGATSINKQHFEGPDSAFRLVSDDPLMSLFMRKHGAGRAINPSSRA